MMINSGNRRQLREKPSAVPLRPLGMSHTISHLGLNPVLLGDKKKRIAQGRHRQNSQTTSFIDNIRISLKGRP